MANSTPFRTTDALGPQLDDVFTTLPYWDSTLNVGRAATEGSASYKLGDVERGSDGGEYFFVKASADIAATATTGTQVTITFPAYTVATGAGGFYTPVNTEITSGSYFHVRRGAANAVPA
jgi:hypothetical protein